MLSRAAGYMSYTCTELPSCAVEVPPPERYWPFFFKNGAQKIGQQTSYVATAVVTQEKIVP